MSLLGELNKPRVHRARHGIGRGYKQVGGVGLTLPWWVQRLRQEHLEHVAAEEAFLRSLDLTGKTVYDVGSFHGIVAMFFASQAAPGGKVIAFEPHPDSFGRLCEHLELNEIDNVTPVNAGIAAQTGTLELAGDEGQASANASIQHSLAAGGEPLPVHTVPVYAIDDIAGTEHPDPDFVKIDVEGLEGEVLEGMAETIGRCRPELFVEMHGANEADKRANADRVVGLLSGHGYALRHVQSGQPLSAETADRAMRGHIHAS